MGEGKKEGNVIFLSAVRRGTGNVNEMLRQLMLADSIVLFTTNATKSDLP